jgi:hypothetical protein
VIAHDARTATRGVGDFLRALLTHWKSFVTGGLITGSLWVFQGVGWMAPHPWIYWTTASLGLLVAAYQAWADERQKVIALTTKLNSESSDKKRKVIEIVTALRGLQAKVLEWRGITNGQWGMARPAETLQVEDLPAILFEAGEIRLTLRAEMEMVARNLTKAESLIIQFQSQPALYRQEQLMRQSYSLLDEAAPHLSNVIAEFEAFEKSLG